MYLEDIKKEIAKQANKALGKKLVSVSDFVYPPNPEMGELSLPCFDLAKKLGQNPNSIASLLLKSIKSKNISGAKALGPYFNLSLNKETLVKAVLSEIAEHMENYGKSEEFSGQKIVVEYGQPNPFKAFHIGHLRNIVMGESICRLLESRGAEVFRVNYQGDVGMHIAKCLWAFQKVKPEDYPKTTDEKVALIGQCYAEGAKAFENNQVDQEIIKMINQRIYSREDKEINKLWELGKEWSMEKFHQIYERVYVKFEKEYMESEVMEDGIKKTKLALKKGILKKSEGAVVFSGSKYKLDTRVFMNSQGLPTYEGKELGLAFREFSDFGKIDKCIHVVGSEQKSFFQVTFKVEELLDVKKFKGKQYHLSYELVGLKKGKMSSRTGNVVLGDEILSEARAKVKKIIVDRDDIDGVDETSEIIGTAAVKYAFLGVSPQKYLAFDLDQSVSFEGNSGPYLLYSLVRINSIFKKAGMDLKKNNPDFSVLTDSKESDLCLKLAMYPEIVMRAAAAYDPSEIAKYIFELAKTFNDYYHAVPVIKAEDEVKLARLALLSYVSQVIHNGLDLLDIKTVEKM